MCDIQLRKFERKIQEGGAKEEDTYKTVFFPCLVQPFLQPSELGLGKREKFLYFVESRIALWLYDATRLGR